MNINLKSFNNRAYQEGFQYLSHGRIPNLSSVGEWKFKQKWDQFTLLNGKIYFNQMEVVPIERKEAILNEKYQKSLRGRDALYETYIKGKYIGITKTDVNNFLKKQETHQLHRTKFTIKKVRPLVIARPLVRWQIDLIDYKSHNYIMTIIDCFSKYGYARILRYKKAKNTRNVLEQIINEHYYPHIVHTDNGTEFSSTFDDLLEDYGIKHIRGQPYRSTSQGIVERFNKTVLEMINRRFTQDNNRQLTNEKLQNVINEYNKTYHSTIKKTPESIHIFRNTEEYKKGTRTTSKLIKQRARKITVYEDARFPKLIKGDSVRIALTSILGKERRLAKSNFLKAYKGNWTHETFKVKSISRPTKKYTLPRYRIINNENEDYGQLFTRDELLKI